MSSDTHYRDSFVNIKKKGFSTIKFVDEALTAADVGVGDRTIYSKIYMTYNGQIINGKKDIRVWKNPSNQNINNMNAVIEIPEGTDLIYETQNSDPVFNYFAPYENGQTGLQEAAAAMPASVSYGFLPRTLNSTSYDYRANSFMVGVPDLEAYVDGNGDPLPVYGDGDALDVIVFGSPPGAAERQICEVVNIKIITCVVGLEDNGEGNPKTFEAVCIGFALDDPTWAGINSLAAWNGFVSTHPSGPTILGGITALLDRETTITTADFKDSTYTNNLVRHQINLFHDSHEL